MNKPYLILGSSGLIGSNLVKFLGEENCYQYDILRGSEEDLRNDDTEYLEDKISNCEFCYFLAYEIGGSKYLSAQQKQFDFIDSNISIMRNTFRALKRCNKPFLFASSQMQSMTDSPYGTLKNIGEFYTRSLGGVNVRFWNVVGVEHYLDTNKNHLITDLVESAAKQGVINLRTTGKEKRQFLHVYDACRALDLVSNTNLYANEPLLDITSFEWRSILDVAEIVANYFNCPFFANDQKDLVQNDIMNEPDRTILEFWQPKITLEDCVLRIIKDMGY